MNSDMSQMQLSPCDYLAHISDEIDKITVGHSERKNKFCKHIQKLIQEAEKYGKYLRSQWQKAKKAGLTSYDEKKDKEKWSWWTAYSETYVGGPNVYFNDDEVLDVQFYIQGKPKPDPLSYLRSMIWGTVGQAYEGLELLDYQFTLLAIIHDAQNWQAGRNPIYFNYNRRKREDLKDRLCYAVWDRLAEYNNSYFFRDVQQTIETAMLAVRAELNKQKQVKPPGKTGQGSSKNEKTTISSCRRLYKEARVFVGRIPYCIYIFTLFFAAALTCLYYMGCLEPFKSFISTIVSRK